MMLIQKTLAVWGLRPLNYVAENMPPQAREGICHVKRQHCRRVPGQTETMSFQQLLENGRFSAAPTYTTVLKGKAIVNILPAARSTALAMGSNV